jgi:ComF family protein
MWHLLLKLQTYFRAGYQCLLDLCYPRDCYFCRKPAGEEGYICQECLERLSLHRNPSCTRCGVESTLLDGPDFVCSECLKHPPAIERTFIVTRYENAFRDLIHTFKYRKGIWLTEDLGRYLLATYLERIQNAGITIDVIIPVPIQAAKHRTRGYNQTDLLADYLAKNLNLPVKKHALKRVKTGIISQTRLHRRERLQNAKRAYRLTRHVTLTDLNVLLVDDVVTTGATCNACAELLRNAGAKAVYVLALARPLNP